MDIAGAVVGVTSLSITLCDGIVSYCHAWRHQDDDVRSLSALCETLRELLQAIEQRVQSSQSLDPSIVTKLNATLQESSRQNEAILKLSQKYAAARTVNNWKDKPRELALRLIFPFEKKTLEELKTIKLAFRGNVDTALGLLNL